jgi:hypothetical protein
MNRANLLGGLQWLGILAFVVRWALSVPAYVEMWSNPYWPPIVIGECLLNGAMLAVALYTAVMLMKRRRIFPKLFSVQLALVSILPLITLVWIAEGTGVGFTIVFYELGPLVWLAAGIVCTVLWMAYANRSAWVKETFVA